MPNVFEANSVEDGVYPHKCEEPGCNRTVPFDDEPKCFQHSPDAGSSVRGYSAREKAEKGVPYEQPKKYRRIEVWVDIENADNEGIEIYRRQLESRCWEVVRGLPNVRVQANEATSPW